MSRAQERIAKAREKIQVIAHDFCQIYKDEKGSSYLTAFYIPDKPFRSNSLIGKGDRI